jgi:hypothetical protein
LDNDAWERALGLPPWPESKKQLGLPSLDHGTYCSGLIHRSAWKGNSQKSISTILDSLPLWERRMAYFPALELIAKHKISEE